MTIPIFALESLTGSTTQLIACGEYNWLVSYWLIKDKKNINEVLFEIDRPDGSIFMLDSGAFSAWNKGFRINLWDYIDFIKKYYRHFTHIVCLDVIDNPTTSRINYLIMSQELADLNLKIIPVYHSGERFSVLGAMINEAEYIGISPNNNWNESSKLEWLADIEGRYNFSKFSTHGFGYTSIKGLGRFSLTTADSTSWRLGAAYGGIIIPRGLVKISTKVGDLFNKNFIEVSNSDFVLGICNELNIKVEHLREDYYLRLLFNIKSTVKLINDDIGLNEKSTQVKLVQSDFGIPFDFDFKEKYALAKKLNREYTGE